MINILSDQGLIEETHYTILKGVDGRDISQDEVDRINKTRMKYYKENGIFLNDANSSMEDISKRLNGYEEQVN